METGARQWSVIVTLYGWCVELLLSFGSLKSLKTVLSFCSSPFVPPTKHKARLGFFFAQSNI